MKLEKHAKDAAATERIARELAKKLKPPLVVLLDGDLGAGKTTFARGFVRALAGGSKVVVQSPTFALARTYPTRPVVHHLDLYRLDDARGLVELGLFDLLGDPDAFSLVEWPRDLSPPGFVARVHIVGEHGRTITADIPDESVSTPVRRAPKRKRHA
jgi:tRNA threonylcarbamoyl adenosine modification protein YjeE